MKKHLKGPSYRGPGVRTESRTQAALLLPELSPNVILQASRSRKRRSSQTVQVRRGRQGLGTASSDLNQQPLVKLNYKQGRRSLSMLQPCKSSKVSNQGPVRCSQMVPSVPKKESHRETRPGHPKTPKPPAFGKLWLEHLHTCATARFVDVPT